MNLYKKGNSYCKTGVLEVMAIYTYFLQSVISRETAETGFINRMIFTIRIVLLQKVKEPFCRGATRVSCPLLHPFQELLLPSMYSCGTH